MICKSVYKARVGKLGLISHREHTRRIGKVDAPQVILDCLACYVLHVNAMVIRIEHVNLRRIEATSAALADDSYLSIRASSGKFSVQVWVAIKLLEPLFHDARPPLEAHGIQPSFGALHDHRVSAELGGVEARR